MEAYAHESDRHIAVAGPPQDDLSALLDPSSEVRLAARPAMGEFLSAESWASQVSGTLVVKAPLDAVKRLPLDHRAGFLLSLMDGSLDLEMLVEVSGMDREEVIAIVHTLHESGVVDFR
jgi:hypothetical protein